MNSHRIYLANNFAVTHEERWQDKTRGAFGFVLIFFVTFFHQGKKVSEYNSKLQTSFKGFKHLLNNHPKK